MGGHSPLPLHAAIHAFIPTLSQKSMCWQNKDSFSWANYQPVIKESIDNGSGYAPVGRFPGQILLLQEWKAGWETFLCLIANNQSATPATKWILSVVELHGSPSQNTINFLLHMETMHKEIFVNIRCRVSCTTVMSWGTLLLLRIHLQKIICVVLFKR